MFGRPPIIISWMFSYFLHTGGVSSLMFLSAVVTVLPTDFSSDMIVTTLYSTQGGALVLGEVMVRATRKIREVTFRLVSSVL
jgi:hypothetical protein